MTMKLLAITLGLLLSGAALAGDDAAKPADATHRYIVERTFPKGALDGLDAATKAKVNQTNARFGVRWVTSYANADKTRTFCVYEAPDELAIREAAKANALPVDSISEVPVTLDPH
jgi:hypothetical protein